MTKGYGSHVSQDLWSYWPRGWLLETPKTDLTHRKDTDWYLLSRLVSRCAIFQKKNKKKHTGPGNHLSKDPKTEKYVLVSFYYLHVSNKLQKPEISDANEGFLGGINVKSLQCLVCQCFPVTLCYPQTGDLVSISAEKKQLTHRMYIRLVTAWV